MAGSGTTGYVAQTLKRDFIMIEIDPNYVKGMRERFKQPLRMTDSPYPNKKHISQYMELESHHRNWGDPFSLWRRKYEGM